MKATWVAAVLVSLTVLSVAEDRPKQRQPKEVPVTLSWKEKPAEPIDPATAVPEIVYRKQAGFTGKEAAWIVEIDGQDDGTSVTHTIQAGDGTFADGTFVIPIPEETGTIAGKHGMWEKVVGAFCVYARGTGRMRFALVDLSEARRKKEVTNEMRISNWVEVSVDLAK